MHLYLTIYQDSFALNYLKLRQDLLSFTVSITQKKQASYFLLFLPHKKTGLHHIKKTELPHHKKSLVESEVFTL